jgi:hypothetical protein
MDPQGRLSGAKKSKLPELAGAPDLILKAGFLGRCRSIIQNGHARANTASCDAGKHRSFSV